MRLGRSRPIPALLLRQAAAAQPAAASATAALSVTATAAPKAPATATASLTVTASHFALPWREDFSGGNWSRWVTSPTDSSGSIAVALGVTGGQGYMAQAANAVPGGGRAYPLTSPGSVSS